MEYDNSELLSGEQLRRVYKNCDNIIRGKVNINLSKNEILEDYNIIFHKFEKFLSYQMVVELFQSIEKEAAKRFSLMK